eukprot:gnl/MRDRNA2_/MRDRNA2_121712_c0_seq1.p1 gnl/MRDRNA2_/MRDRNA2_121712_c0~~gnl/MRDRNA2_/MRDRNA2_121712_c0_seq1.p1  ORF type:complete len:288 (-),score=52.03 gnl/MRDRNA2_/MRDRNA2_121712_c0_seq1:106-969(-)
MTMCSVIIRNLLAFVALAHSSSAQGHVVGKLALRAFTKDDAELDSAILGKPGHVVVISPRSSLLLDTSPRSAKAHIPRLETGSVPSQYSSKARRRGFVVSHSSKHVLPCDKVIAPLLRRDTLTGLLFMASGLIMMPASAAMTPGLSSKSGGTSSGVCQIKDDVVEVKSKISDPQKFVADAMQKKGLVVFGKSYCDCTDQWVKFLKSENADMTMYYLDELGEPANGPVQQELEKITGILSCPQVFVNGKYVGGGKTLDMLEAPAALRKKLQDEGATFGPSLEALQYAF